MTAKSGERDAEFGGVPEASLERAVFAEVGVISLPVFQLPVCQFVRDLWGWKAAEVHVAVIRGFG